MPFEMLRVGSRYPRLRCDGDDMRIQINYNNPVWELMVSYRGISDVELNELLNGDGKKNSSETNYLKTAVCRIVAASLGLASITQMRKEEIPAAREKAETILGWIREAEVS